MRGGRRLEQFDSVRTGDIVMYRRADRRSRKNSEERCVSAADVIATINRGNRANHSFEHLVAEFALASRGFSTQLGLPEAALYFPNRENSNRESHDQRDDVPKSNRSRCRHL